MAEHRYACMSKTNIWTAYRAFRLVPNPLGGVHIMGWYSTEVWWKPWTWFDGRWEEVAYAGEFELGGKRDADTVAAVNAYMGDEQVDLARGAGNAES